MLNIDPKQLIVLGVVTVNLLILAYLQISFLLDDGPTETDPAFTHEIFSLLPVLPLKEALVVGVCIVAFLCACAVPMSLNPVNALFALIVTFLINAILLVSNGVEFLGYILLIVYVGAVAILFLFVIMLLNVRELVDAQRNRVVDIASNVKNFFLVFVGFSLLASSNLLNVIRSIPLPNSHSENRAYQGATALYQHTNLEDNDIQALAHQLYLEDTALFLQITLILLVAMVGAIVLATTTTATQTELSTNDTLLTPAAASIGSIILFSPSAQMEFCNELCSSFTQLTNWVLAVATQTQAFYVLNSMLVHGVTLLFSTIVALSVFTTWKEHRGQRATKRALILAFIKATASYLLFATALTQLLILLGLTSNIFNTEIRFANKLGEAEFASTFLILSSFLLLRLQSGVWNALSVYVRTPFNVGVSALLFLTGLRSADMVRSYFTITESLHKIPSLILAEGRGWSARVRLTSAEAETAFHTFISNNETVSVNVAAKLRTFAPEFSQVWRDEGSGAALSLYHAQKNAITNKVNETLRLQISAWFDWVWAGANKVVTTTITFKVDHPYVFWGAIIGTVLIGCGTTYYYYYYYLPYLPPSTAAEIAALPWELTRTLDELLCSRKSRSAYFYMRGRLSDWFKAGMPPKPAEDFVEIASHASAKFTLTFKHAWEVMVIVVSVTL